jgi:hypothetical protein
MWDTEISVLWAVEDMEWRIIHVMKVSGRTVENRHEHNNQKYKIKLLDNLQIMPRNEMLKLLHKWQRYGRILINLFIYGWLVAWFNDAPSISVSIAMKAGKISKQKL